MQATTMPKIVAGLTRNSSTLSTKIARLKHTSAAAQYLSDVRKTYRLSMGTLFIPLVPSVHLHSRDIQAGGVAGPHPLECAREFSLSESQATARSRTNRAAST